MTTVRSCDLWMSGRILWKSTLSTPSDPVDNSSRQSRRRDPLDRFRSDLVLRVAFDSPLAGGQDTCAGSAQTTRTAPVVDTSASPSSRISGVAQPSLASTPAAPSISATADCPFIATIAPVGATSGIDQRSSRSNGATAREVTTSKVRTPASSSARPRTTSTFSRPRSATTSLRKTVRRSSGSTSTKDRSGRAMASTRPGRPAPEPMSATDAPSGRTSPRSAQFKMWRSHRRGTSRGPISPRTTPASASHSAYRSANSNRSDANTLRAESGTEGVRSLRSFTPPVSVVSRETPSFTRVLRPHNDAVRLPLRTTSDPRPRRRREPPCARTATSGSTRRGSRSPSPSPPSLPPEW